MPTLPLRAVPPVRSRAGRRTAAAVLTGVMGALTVLSAVGGPLPAARADDGTPARGVLDRLAVEPAPGRSSGTPTTWLRTTDGPVPISADAAEGIPTGSTVAVRLGPEELGADGARVRRVRSLRVLARTASTPRTAPASAVHAVTVVLALPAGARADSTTPAALARVVSGGVASYWSRASDGRITFSVARTVGWTTLSSSCSDVWSVWDEVRRRVGFAAANRRHLLVYAPATSGCPTGLATVGSGPDAGGLAIVGGTTPGLLAHELGHNLGLGHSEALACTGVSDAPPGGEGYGPACRRIPYGDWYDVMGISWENLGSLSTAHAYRLGLLGAGSVITTSGATRVTLRPVSTRTGLRSLRIQDPAGATYVVEYRPAAGVDRWLDTADDWRGLRAGALLRRVDPDDPTQTLLLDGTPPATPASGGSVGSDVDVVLEPGRPVTTASGRVSVVLESVSPGAATVAVALDGVWPVLVVEPLGRLVNGRQVTIGQALATWGSLAS